MNGKSKSPRAKWTTPIARKIDAKDIPDDILDKFDKMMKDKTINSDIYSDDGDEIEYI